MQHFSCGKQAKSKDFLQNRHTYDVQFIFWLLMLLLVYRLLFLLHLLLSFFRFIFLFFCHLTTSVVHFHFIPPLYSLHHFNLRLLFHLHALVFGIWFSFLRSFAHLYAASSYILLLHFVLHFFHVFVFTVHFLIFFLCNATFLLLD